MGGFTIMFVGVVVIAQVTRGRALQRLGVL
ncbi:hypothetical protein QE364_003910 [Nocardioides zeae]|uniref:Uncharacterized protein n=1 Tax=Nocardioides zeae TaxID=1457234 RepID=A0ACC6IN77_9ACTN|nr:hypothetical protein [Nocardioides zeae]